MQTITRKRYLDTLSVLKDKNLIKVATGVRRCGKSTLMTQFQELIRKENSKSPILAINMDMPEFRFLAEKNWKEIYDYIIKRLKKNVTNYVFIDEVQNVVEFEKLLEGLYVHPNVDLYVTGSNAFLLSSELATLLTGRAYEINVLPFSFVEYLEFTGKTVIPAGSTLPYAVVQYSPFAKQEACHEQQKEPIGHCYRRWHDRHCCRHQAARSRHHQRHPA